MIKPEPVIEEVEVWKTLKDEPIADIAAWVAEATKDGQEVHVGCDSLQHNRFTSFCVVIGILTPSKGGRAAYVRTRVARIKHLRQRLLAEVAKSIDVAIKLSPMASGPITVHVDANPVAEHKSSAYVQELVGYVVGSGFRAVIKPDAWLATTCADHAVRGLNKIA
jgi:predicted RNase H-related nuclease YkuK (DUF458 family)